MLKSDQTLIKVLQKQKTYSGSKKSGADAVKFQLFDGSILYPNDLKMQRIFQKIELNKKWIKKLKRYSKKINIDFFLSVLISII